MIHFGKEIDVIDFGASKRASIELSKRYLNGINGLGIDISKDKVLHMRTF